MENGRTDSAAISIKMFVQKVGWGDSGVAGCKALRAGSIFFQNETVDSELTRGRASFVTDKPLLEAGSLTRRQAQQKPSAQSARPDRRMASSAHRPRPPHEPARMNFRMRRLRSCGKRPFFSGYWLPFNLWRKTSPPSP